MALIDWDDNMSVNVKKIDQQHQKLIAIMNNLFEAMTEGKGKQVLDKTVDQLLEYTEIHFKTEEIFFDQFEYSETDSHKKEHEDFIEKVSAFKDGTDRGKLGLSVDVMHFLSRWLENHIMKTDKKYSRFFNENGLS